MPAPELDWDGLRYFLAAIAAGTYSGAAQQLRVNRTTVARQIQMLEHALDTTLFEQTAEGYQPTHAGRQVMATARKIETEIDALLRLLAGEEQSLQGPLRVAVPIGLGAEFMNEIAQFSHAHKGIRLELINVANPLASISARKADVAIAVSNALPEHLRAQNVCRMSRAIYASRQYIKRKPATLALDKHDWIGWSAELAGSESAQWMQQNLPEDVSITIRVNSWHMMREAVLSGLGIGHLWCFLADQDKRLVRIRNPSNELAIGLWLVTHKEIPPNARTQLFLDAMTPLLKQKAAP